MHHMYRPPRYLNYLCSIYTRRSTLGVDLQYSTSVCTHRYTLVWIYSAVCVPVDTLQCGSAVQCINT